MRRRTLLAAAAAVPTAFAGCLADAPGEFGDDGSGDGTGDGGADGTPDGSPDDGSVVGHFDGQAVRPECHVAPEAIEVEVDGETRSFETAGTVPYPDEPASVAGNAAVDYVTSFEEAYVTQDVLCDRQGRGEISSFGYDVRRSETFEWYDDVEVVFLLRAAGATGGIDGDGHQWVADLGYEGVVYAVDETGVARVTFDDVHAHDLEEAEDHAPDPLETGQLVAVFE